jgi:hypothetical protein
MVGSLTRLSYFASARSLDASLEVSLDAASPVQPAGDPDWQSSHGKFQARLRHAIASGALGL